MIYPYRCLDCKHEFNVIKSFSVIERTEHCEKCDAVCERTIAPSYLGNTAEFIASFNPAFGKVVKSRNHQREILAEFKDKGKEMEEVGNEPLEKIHSYHDNKREQIRQEKWANVDREMLYE